MENQKEIIKELERLNQNKLIKIQDSDEERRVFINSDEVFNIFGKEEKGVLTPFDDYTYEWLNSFLSDVIDLLNSNEFESIDELEDAIQEQILEWADSETDVYTSDLTKWLGHNNYNAFLVDEVAKEGITENVIMTTQCRAIEELFNNALRVLINWLKENYEGEA